MSANVQKQLKIGTIPATRGPLVETLESAVERGTLSAKLLRGLTQKFGLKATKKAIVACVRDLENLRHDVERQLKAIDKQAGVLGLKQIMPRR